MPTLFNDGRADIGVHGHSNSHTGVFGDSYSGFGVHGQSTTLTGVEARSKDGVALYAESANKDSIVSFSNLKTAVIGRTNRGWGVHGFSNENIGMFGLSTSSTGVYGRSTSGFGVHGHTDYGIGVVGWGPHAGDFQGEVTVTGSMWCNRTFYCPDKRFRIDHPSDPQNRYLLHSAVESNERKNVYDGVAQLDADGTAWVQLDEWFETLNEDFRYQLTAVGGPAPNLHVAEEVYENRFQIAGGEGGMKVCWQVTGTRKDPWAAAYPFEVEEEKPQEERGRYMHPSLYGAPEEQNVMRARIPQPPPTPSVEPPQLPTMPPGAPAATPVFDHDVYLQEQLDELRGQIEELMHGRVEDERRRELDDLRRQIEELRRRRK